MSGRLKEWTMTAPSMGWQLLFFVLPTLLVFGIAFRPTMISGGVGEAWSLDTWRNLFEPSYPAIIWRTVWLSVATTVVCVMAAAPVAYCLARQGRRLRNWTLLLIIVPLCTNVLIQILAWKGLLHSDGFLQQTLVSLGLLAPETDLLNNKWTVLLALIYAYLPFAILPVYAAAERFDFRLLEAARDLGAGKWQAFRKIFLPGIRGGLGIAAVLVFIQALGSYVIPGFLGGAGNEMLGNEIGGQVFVDRDLESASALTCILGVMVLLPAIWSLLSQRTEVMQKDRFAMRSSRLTMLVTAAVLLFLYMPIVALTVSSFNDTRTFGAWSGFTLQWYEELFSQGSREARDIWRAAANTMIVAGSAAGISAIGGTLAAWVIHQGRSRLQGLHKVLLCAPVLVPSFLIGISLLMLFENTDTPLGLETIIIAHATFCMGLVALVVLRRLREFDPTLIDAARDLGAGRSAVFRRILMPLLWPGMAAGALLAFSLSVADFVATSFTTGLEHTTLPLKLYSMMQFESPTLIHALAVVMIAVTFVLLMIAQGLLQKGSK